MKFWQEIYPVIIQFAFDAYERFNDLDRGGHMRTVPFRRVLEFDKSSNVDGKERRMRVK